MSKMEGHLDHLKQKHADADAELSELLKDRHFDEARVGQLKKEKLLYKDEIAAIIREQSN